MGLDMYLSAKKYHSAAEWRPSDTREEFAKLKQASGVGAVLDKVEHPHIYLEVSVGYWRKQNAIHEWFVTNCQDGVDDCRNSYVGREQLESLLNTCKEVKSDHSKADDLLPTASGFFFGSTEYDEWYFGGIDETIEIIEMALAMPEEWEFQYHSSW
jgi:hypothetical protein